MISFDCLCGKPFRFSLKFQGRPFRCNTCGRPLVVQEGSVKTDLDEIITPVTPVLQIDLGSLAQQTQPQPPESLPTPAILDYSDDIPTQRISVSVTNADAASESDIDDDEIIISGSLSKIEEKKNMIHVDLDIETKKSGEEDSISTVLSKAAISRHMKEQQEAAQPGNEPHEPSPGPKLAKKAGLFSGIFRKKPKDAPKITEKAPKKVKQEKAADTSGIPLKKSSKIPVTLLMLLLSWVLFLVAFGAFYWERTQTNAEREKVANLEREVKNLRNQLNDLRQNQTPHPTGSTGISDFEQKVTPDQMLEPDLFLEPPQEAFEPDWD